MLALAQRSMAGSSSPELERAEADEAGLATGAGALAAALGLPASSVEDAPRDSLEVRVEADDAERKFIWTCRLVRAEPVRLLVARWARAFDVTPEAVGFQDATDLVDLARTPAELGWAARSCVHLRAVPLDARFVAPAFEQRAAAAARPSAAAAPGARAAGSRRSAPRRGREVLAPPRKRARLVGKQRPDQGTVGTAQTALAARGRQSQRQPNSPVPNDQEVVIFDAANPKRDGCRAHARYERYKAATTVRQAMDLGAQWADIAYDFSKGYMKRA